MKGHCVHFIGIGGIGMSGIARIYLAMGWTVRGSDLRSSDILTDLERRGAKVFIGHDARHVDGADLVVYSSSIEERHPEREEAGKRGIRIFHRAEALAEICRGKRTIAVTGTHGKTTTTALIGMILREAGRDPSIVVGGWVPDLEGNAVYGRGGDMVIEADESDSSFLRFRPFLEVITNVEEEHMDHFRDAEHIRETYRNFVERLPEEGEWFGCAEDPCVAGLAGESSRKHTLYGFSDACGVFAREIQECPGGGRGVSFEAWREKERLGKVEMSVMGRHNVLNALAAIGVGMRLGVPFETAARALKRYRGTRRRFDVRYEDSDFMVVDDYAHHPTEIQRTLEAAKALGRKRIVALFQPHRYTRVKALLEGFGKSFRSADKLIVTDIYAASEKPIQGITAGALCAEIKRLGHPDTVFMERDKLAAYTAAEIRSGDLVMCLGAGDITQTAEELGERLRRLSKDGLEPRKESGGDARLIKRSHLLFGAVRGRVLLEEPLARHTTLKIGGPAQVWIEPQDLEDLKQVLALAGKESLPVTIFGFGSNLLVPDEGIRGVVVCLASSYFREIRPEEGGILARAGAPNALFIQYALEQGFGGFEFLSGIPGNIGGSVAMNAGSHGESIDSLVRRVRVMSFNGEERWLERSEVPFRYRSSGIREVMIVEALFSLPRIDRRKVREKLEEYREHRSKTQDLQHPSAGCMFKNPGIPGSSSGRLIEEAGLKGKRIGHAQISTKHGNFIVNCGGATAKDVLLLMEEARKAVKEKFDIELETEVKVL